MISYFQFSVIYTDENIQMKTIKKYNIYLNLMNKKTFNKFGKNLLVRKSTQIIHRNVYNHKSYEYITTHVSFNILSLAHSLSVTAISWAGSQVTINTHSHVGAL